MELDQEMANLDLNERKRRMPQADNEEIEKEINDKNTETLRRSSRKKIKPLVENRRVEMKPTKLSMNEELEKIKSYYLDKTVKRLSTSLETIFEEPFKQKGKVSYYSGRKLRRALNFSPTSALQQNKLKKRSMKAKKCAKVKKKKFSIEKVIETLKCIEEI